MRSGARAEGAGATVHFYLLAPSPTAIGGYKVVYEYANAIAELGLDVHIWHSGAFAAEASRGFPRFRRRAGALVDWWLRGGRRRWREDGVPWFPLSPRVITHASPLLPRKGVHVGDVVIATAVETTTFAGRRAREAGASSLALIQHYETWAADEEYILSAWGSVDERVVIAPWLQQKCEDGGLTSHLLPNALDPEAFPAGPPLVERPEVVLSLLSPHGYKRPDVVVSALEAVARMRPVTEVVAFGQSAEAPLASDVVKYVPNPSPAQLRAMYQRARVYLCGSDAEGWHLPPGEATLSGAAVVSTDIGGVRASMGDDALYAPPSDALGLAERAVRILDDPAPAQMRVDRARRRLLGVTVERNARALLDIAGVAAAVSDEPR